MLSRFKKKLSEIKTDLNYRIDQLEVDKNYVFHKTQRHIQSSFTKSGTNFLRKKNQEINEIEETSKRIEKNSQNFEKQVKEVALVYTTNLFYHLRTFEKELQSIIKSIEYTKNTIEKIHDVCLMLNENLMELDYIYSELEYKKIMEKHEKIQEDVLDEDVLCNEDKIELNDKSVKLVFKDI